MKRSTPILAAVVILASTPVPAANSNFGVLINIGTPSPPLVPIEPKTATPVKAPTTPGLPLEVGVPYDLVPYDGRYFARQKGKWFTGTHTNGPWQPITWKELPARVRQQFESAREQQSVVYGEDDGG